MREKRFILENGLHLSFAVALIATVGSLYLSEIMKFAPCELCWFQRIFMYPLVLLLGVASVKKDYGISVYALPLAAIGGLISVYHYLVQKSPWFGEHAISCNSLVPCNADYLDWFGIITIPMLALIAFILIIILLVALRNAVARVK
jgi:disulfide bond formation protein DsbB